MTILCRSPSEGFNKYACLGSLSTKVNSGPTVPNAGVTVAEFGTVRSGQRLLS